MSSFAGRISAGVGTLRRGLGDITPRNGAARGTVSEEGESGTGGEVVEAQRTTVVSKEESLNIDLTVELGKAVHFGDVETMRTFVQSYGKDVVVLTNKREQNALHLAAEAGNEKLTGYLIALNRSLVKGVDRNGWTPLHSAAASTVVGSSANVCMQLLRAGAAVDAATEDGATPLHYAVRMPMSREVLALLDELEARGADLNVGNGRGESALAAAASRGCIDAAAWLLSRGADPTIADAKGLTPFAKAAMRGDRHVCGLLRDAGVQVDDQAREFAEEFHFTEDLALVLKDRWAVSGGSEKRRRGGKKDKNKDKDKDKDKDMFPFERAATDDGARLVVGQPCVPTCNAAFASGFRRETGTPLLSQSAASQDAHCTLTREPPSYQREFVDAGLDHFIYVGYVERVPVADDVAVAAANDAAVDAGEAPSGNERDPVKLGKVLLVVGSTPVSTGEQSIFKCLVFGRRSSALLNVQAAALRSVLSNPSRDFKDSLAEVCAAGDVFGVGHAHQLRFLVQAVAEERVPDVAKSLTRVEKSDPSRNAQHCVGAVVARNGDSASEAEIFSTPSMPPNFNSFMQWLAGDRIKLEGFSGFRGDLDVKTNTTGTESHFATLDDPAAGKTHEIMFHVAPLLPYEENAEQQVVRKRRIGNDMTVIVFLEDGEGAYLPPIASQVLHVYVIVSPVTIKGETFYRISISRRDGVESYGPPLAAPNVYRRTPELRRRLLTKLINGQLSAVKCASLASKISWPARADLLDEVVSQNYVAESKVLEMGKWLLGA